MVSAMRQAAARGRGGRYERTAARGLPGGAERASCTGKRIIIRSRWRVNDFKIGARGMHGPCEKRTRGSDSERSLALVTPVGWPAARAVPCGLPRQDWTTGHAMRAPYLLASIPLNWPFLLRTTAVLVRDTSS